MTAASEARYENLALVEKLGQAQGRSEFQEIEGQVIRDIVREHSFLDLIIEPDDVKETDPEVQRSLTQDTLVYIVDIEPNSWAMTSTFRGMPDAHMISADRVAVGFGTMNTPTYEKTEQELRVYPYSITGWIEKNMPKDIDAVADWYFIKYVDQAVQAMQTSVNTGTGVAYNRTNINAAAANTTAVRIVKGEQALTGSAGTDDFTVRMLQRPDLTKLYNLIEIDNGKLVECVLIGATDQNDLNSWVAEDLGDANTGETLIKGWKWGTLMGKKMIRTSKTTLVKPGNIYAFCGKSFLGRNLVLDKLQFFVKKEGRTLSWYAEMDRGMIIANVASIAKLELYRGSARPTALDAGSAARLPVTSPSDVYTPSHRVPEGDIFPSIAMY
jgi:hypothetical protein